jgi:hypothetical protein
LKEDHPMSFHLRAVTSNAIKVLPVLAVAAAASVAILAVPATQALAADNGPADPGVRCAAKVGPGEYEFYLPGERATDVNGNKWVCGPDGQWFRDYSALVKSPVIQLAPLRTISLSGATLLAR